MLVDAVSTPDSAVAALVASLPRPAVSAAVCTSRPHPAVWRRARRFRPTAANALAGIRDNASATTFVAPGRYSTSKSNSCRVKPHLWSLPVRLALVISHFKAA
ncbi:hypothetical protein PF005_g23167 [Phytophthora fragariae]|uniref:Uncharacterized protein n=1 Tax=Phytophthora fragariae TaxID=53985 RepID=A0A6A3IVB3_9STRA|nr:hypothetical protein PF003_g23771 [Phytophthora fragariae]KAE8984315.1 hypothetical protein PF011_g20828 [Phytophthora fragariae]KAE9107039.1 hypothetical protein PF006_g21218 [Phytophthora fragariae]KAE9180724.1 hypothetical protein PF005_g23167 [Phytophthora fragariae]